MNASPLTTLIPTRKALNPPGPSATAIPLKSPGASLCDRRIWSTAGINSAEWFTDERQHLLESARPASQTATPACLVEVSIASNTA